MLGREICGHWHAAISREWLVTNGLGGYACGTVAGANTRRYHGFLMASLEPPVRRMLLVAKVDIDVDYLGSSYPLSANEFAGTTVDPRGFVHLESFAVEHGIPVWRYAIADAVLEQKIFMAPGANTSYLRLELLRAGAPVRVRLKPLVTYRDDHAHSRGLRPFRALPHSVPHAVGCAIDAGDGALPFQLSMSDGTYSSGDTWYWNFLHREEYARGLDAREDLWGPGLFTVTLNMGQQVIFTASAQSVGAASAGTAPDSVLAGLVGQATRRSAALPKSAPRWVQTLATASDQFIVHRGPASTGASIIAGYPWFTDWGRDTMIALPGLTTVLGRHDAAAAILRTYCSVVEDGLLPNRFADTGAVLTGAVLTGAVLTSAVLTGAGREYNTADATLWLFHALHEHLEAKRDQSLLAELFPVLMRIIHAHVDGTRYGIKVDPKDGLLHAGEPGLQLTWMDAKQGERVFTPRIGKPVEINALWLNALDLAARLAGKLRSVAEQRFCETQRQRATDSFSRFWNAAAGCLFDVIDVDADSAGSGSRTAAGTGCDDSIRPNQIFAVSLPYSALSPERMRGVVDTCARELLVSHGLRSLSPRDLRYSGHYTGNSWERDAAYHQGTAWAWLLGPFARAHYRVYGDAALAQSFLAPMAQHLHDACVGSISEIFDGDAPHSPRGCFAQAWSVAEILRSWVFLEQAAHRP